jgi:hypothetical protein
MRIPPFYHEVCTHWNLSPPYDEDQWQADELAVLEIALPEIQSRRRFLRNPVFGYQASNPTRSKP